MGLLPTFCARPSGCKFSYRILPITAGEDSRETTDRSNNQMSGLESANEAWNAEELCHLNKENQGLTLLFLIYATTPSVIPRKDYYDLLSRPRPYFILPLLCNNAQYLIETLHSPSHLGMVSSFHILFPKVALVALSRIDSAIL
jgi:hypothetical protein